MFTLRPHSILSYVLLSTILTACSPKEELYQIHDFISDGIFTNGIEGPAVDRLGNLYAVNFGKQGTIGVIAPQENNAAAKASLFVNLPQGSIGNGLRFDGQGNLYVADYAQHNILKIDMATKLVSEYAHNDKMNQPNDIAIAQDGTLYASDPDWQNSSGNIWKIDTDGRSTLLEADMGTTNGIEVSPDGKTLYVGESVQQKIWQYDIIKNGDVENKRLLITFADHGLDGMRCDKNGNLYVARYGAGVVAIVSQQGELVREVKLKGQHPTNVAFGGRDGRTVFVTMQKRGAIETFRNQIPGRVFSEQ